MKKLFFVFAFLGCLGLVNVNAQGTCPMSKKAAAKTTSVEKKACTKTKAACSKSASAKTVSLDGTTKKSCAATCSKTAAAKLASMDESIEKKVCSKSGNVSYYKKNTCAKSGKVSMAEVKYCSTSKAFVNVSPVAAEAKTVGAKKKACSKSCAKKCSKGKTAAKAAAKTDDAPKAKLIKMEEN